MNKRSFAFDIETTPNAQLIADNMAARKPFDDPPFDPSKWKTQAAKDRNRILWEEGKMDRLKKWEDAENEAYDKAMSAATLRAEQSKVLCISYCDAYGNHVDWADEAGEEGLLDEFWKRCAKTQLFAGKIFTASGTQFDVRFCWRRSMLLGMRIRDLSVFAPSKGYRTQIHRTFVDVSEIYGAGEYGYRIRVDDLAKAFGIDGKALDEGVTGKNFWQQALDDKDKAERYALRDSQIPWEIALKLEANGFFVDQFAPVDEFVGEK